MLFLLINTYHKHKVKEIIELAYDYLFQRFF